MIKHVLVFFLNLTTRIQSFIVFCCLYVLHIKKGKKSYRRNILCDKSLFHFTVIISMLLVTSTKYINILVTKIE